MRQDTKQIIQRIGETDQISLQEKTPELQLERADLRLQLVSMSKSHQEQIHFLQEAIVILEQARIEFEEMPERLYVDLTLHLAKSYMVYFEITHETRFATIAQQILKPITSDVYGDIYFFLAYASASKEEKSLSRHWLTKYSKTSAFNLELVKTHFAFHKFASELWFNQLIQTKLH